MRITITTDRTIFSDSMEKTAAVNNSRTVKAKKSEGNLSSIAEFQKLLGHEMEKIAPSKVPVGTGVRIDPDRTGVGIDTDSTGKTGVKIDTDSTGKTGKDPVVRDVPAGGVDDVDTKSGEMIKAPESLKDIFRRASEKYGVDERLLTAIAYHESRFDPDATSSSGAMGVMQLMPDTAKSHGVKNAYDPEENIMGAAMLVRDLLNAYDGDVTLAMAAYSDGMGAVKRAGGVPDTKQAKEFVSYINSVYPEGVAI